MPHAFVAVPLVRMGTYIQMAGLQPCPLRNVGLGKNAPAGERMYNAPLKVHAWGPRFSPVLEFCQVTAKAKAGNRP